MKIMYRTCEKRQPTGFASSFDTGLPQLPYRYSLKAPLKKRVQIKNLHSLFFISNERFEHLVAAVAGIGAYIAADADKVSYISAVRTSRGFVHCCIPFTCAFASTGISGSSSYYRAYSSRNNDRSSPWHL